MPRFTCSTCNGAVHSNGRPDRIAGRPVCGPCFWAPPPAPPESPPPPAAADVTVFSTVSGAAVLPFSAPRCATGDELDPHERRAARRAA